MLSAAVAAAVGPIREDFEGSEVGKPPSRFSLRKTGPGAAGEWLVREDATSTAGSKVVVQTSTDPTSGRFPLCIYDPLLTKNADVTVRFKTLSGEVDQAGGLVVRFKDNDNYYVARANALEDNVRFYKVVDGSRVQIAGKDVRVAPGTWHVLRLSVQMSRFEVWFDGERLFGAEDTALPEAGEIGLWTKADSVTAFDELLIERSDAH